MSVLVGSNFLVTHVGHMMSVIESSRFKQYEVDYFEILPASYKGVHWAVLFLPSLECRQLKATIPSLVNWSMEPHLTDQSLFGGTRSNLHNNDHTSGTRFQMAQAVDNQNQSHVGHPFPINIPTEQEDTSTWSHTMVRERITSQWCSCNKVVASNPYWVDWLTERFRLWPFGCHSC